MTRLNSQRILTAAICCGIAGFLGFLVQEPGNRASELATAPNNAESVLAESALSFGLLGLLIGAGLVIADEMGATSGRRIGARLVVGAGAGALCGAGGGLVGQCIYSVMLSGGEVNFVSLVVARTIGWAAVGAGTGLSSGLASSNRRKAIQGAVGGGIGGAIGGILFDIIGAVVDSGTGSRLVGDTAIGGFVGAFAVAVEEMAKVAWMTVVSGRNEGKQYILSKPSTSVGRDELSDIPLYGDPSIAKNQATVQTADGRQFTYTDSGSLTGSAINGLRVTQKPLVDGDRVQIGRFLLVFSLKETTAVPVRAYAPGPMIGQPMHNPAVCQFCGGVRDPYTGQCACNPLQNAPMGGIVSPVLQAVSGPHAMRTYPISGLRVEIGRDASNEIVLDMDGGISRHHAIITCENGVYYIHDNNSSNGTYVNGYKVQRAALNQGDTVHLGCSDIRFTF